MRTKHSAALVLVAASTLSTFLWAFFGFQWWVPPDHELKEFLILAFHMVGMIFGTIFLITESS